LDKFVIEGGHPLEGSVTVCGSKNSVLPVLAAGLLTSEPLIIPNAPHLADVDTMLSVLRDLDCGADASDEQRAGEERHRPASERRHEHQRCLFVRVD